METIFTAIDLFAGIGGIRLGFEQAFGKEIKFVFSNEIDSYSCETYEANFGENPLGDITEINPNSIPHFDILLAGFPCQAFSIAGEKRGFNDTRGTLFFNLAEILKIKKPVAFLLENVKHLLNHDKGRTFQVISDVLIEDLGYNIHFKVLNAKNFGVPQNRERIYIVGFKNNYQFKFPKPFNIPVKISEILEDKVDDSFYLSHEYLTGLKNHRARHEAKGNGFGYVVIPRDQIANAIVCGGMGKERNLVKDVILPNCWKEKDDDIQLRNAEGIRKMTPREWARLQGFPESFEFPVSKTRIYRQLGNSVAVPVIKAIALEIKKSLHESIIIEHPPFLKNNKEILIVLQKMFKAGAIPKSGKKFIKSFGKFINDNYLRVYDFQKFLKKLEKYSLITRINVNQIKFTREILNSSSEEDFSNNLQNFLQKTNNQLTLLDYSR